MSIGNRCPTADECRRRAVRLGVSRATVYRLVATDGLPAIRLGGAGRSLRVDEAELEQWLRDRHTPRKEPDDE